MAGKHRSPKLSENARKMTVYIDEDVKEQIQKIAEKDGRSLSTWVAMRIDEEMERLEQERLAREQMDRDRMEPSGTRHGDSKLRAQ